MAIRSPVQPTRTSDITLIVFKDNLAARTFMVPLKWILKLGLFVGFCALLAAAATFLAVKFYRISKTGDPTRFQEIEKELDEVRASYKALESKIGGVPIIPSPTPVESATAPAQPPVTTTSKASSPEMAASLSFLAWVTGKPMEAPPEASTLPIKVLQPKASWHSKTLRVQFVLNYSWTDGGGLQGRVIVLARGPQALLAYPAGVMNSENSTLLDTKRGEYFSVKRLREVRADFGPFLSRKDITEVQVLIFDLNGTKLLYANRLVPEQGPIILPGAKRSTDRDSDTGAEQTPDATTPPAAETPAPPAATEAAPPASTPATPGN